MTDRHTRRVLDHLSNPRYEPSDVGELADQLGVDRDERASFDRAVKQLVEEGRIVEGSSEEVALPPPGREIVGVFRGTDRGFGFIVPEEMTAHGDLFVPPNATGAAMPGDLVRARVRHDKRRAGGGRSPYTTRVIEVIHRADQHYVGTLRKQRSQWVVVPDGKAMGDPILIRDPHAKNAVEGDKVVVEVTVYPEQDGGPIEGVIVERLGEAGEPDVETQGVMRAFGLDPAFPDEVMRDARAASGKFSAALSDGLPEHREDLTAELICTIDPPDAKDYDDAIHVRKLDPKAERDGAAWELGVHIADVSFFVEPGTAIDADAYERGNSTYLPRVVVPMLPEVLSNGVCSLQEGVKRFCKSCFLRYDEAGMVIGERFAETVIESAKRLTYLEAQALIEDDIREARKHTRSEPKYSRDLIQMLKRFDELAKLIRKRRLEAGMIVLGLPEVELVFDDAGNVVDAHPEDDAFTHKIIEMFMVEANDAAARLFDRLDVPMVRRVHPDPDAYSQDELRAFARVAGYNIPARPSRLELQQLLDGVRGKPAERAVHFAVLKTLSKAEYSPQLIGHFALASEHYTHFTSPIRRYPDLVVHRGVKAYLDAAREARKPKAVVERMTDSGLVPDEKRMKQIGRHCSATERNSQQAERELRNYLVLALLEQHLGEEYAGTVTGVTGSGVFVQLDKYLVDGLVRSQDLPGPKGEQWRLNDRAGSLVAQRSGRAISIGDTFTVVVAKVDLGRRSMDLVIVEDPGAAASSDDADGGGKSQGKSKSQSPPRHKQNPGAKKAHAAAMKFKRTKKKDQKGGRGQSPGGGGASGKKSRKKRRGGGPGGGAGGGGKRGG